MKSLPLIILCSVLTGCASGISGLSNPLSYTPRACNSLNQEQQLALNMVKDLAQEGRQHAALAHLNAMPANLPEVRLQQARILRSLDQAGARAQYLSLQNTCLDAFAEQGLGQLAADQGDYPKALMHLRTAVERAPTNADMHNDLGWVALQTGDHQTARFELITALELAPDSKRAALNLLTLLFAQNQWQQAGEMASKFSLSPAQIRDAQAQAEQLSRPNLSKASNITLQRLTRVEPIEFATHSPAPSDSGDTP